MQNKKPRGGCVRSVLWRSKIGLILLTVSLLPLTARAYHLQLLDTSASSPGPVLKVFDENSGTTQTYNGGHSTVSNLTNDGGFVAYSSPGKVNSVAYDPGDRKWHTDHDDIDGNVTCNITIADGIIVSEIYTTSTEESRAYYSAYEPSDRVWHVESDTNARTTYSGLVTSYGALAYLRVQYFCGSDGGPLWGL